MIVKNRSLWTAVFLLAGVATLIAVPGPGRAQDQKDPDRKEPDKNAPMGNVDDKRSDALKKYTGFTRPGYPSDRLGPDNKVVEAADVLQNEDAFGVTICFAVYENQGEKAKEGDTFGTGLPDFDKLFRRGKNDEGLSAPTLNLKGKYLYLYQTVNDRGTAG